MCGIFGFTSANPLGAMKAHELIKRLSIESSVRGEHATGISIVHNGHIVTKKIGKAAKKCNFFVPSGTKAVLGHVRYTTQGSQKYNYNNHPFEGKADVEFALAHNGIISNDEKLRKEQNLPDTHIETDSYIAVQLVEKFGKLSFESLAKVGENLLGMFMLEYLDEHNNIWFVRGDNPICLYYYESLNMYIWASTKEILDKAIKKIKWLSGHHPTEIKIPMGTMVKISNDMTVESKEFDYADPWYGNRGYGAYPVDEELDWKEYLHELCLEERFPEEGITILEYLGYTDVEIEDIVCDTKRRHRILGEWYEQCLVEAEKKSTTTVK